MRRPTLALNEVIFQTLISQFNYLKRLMMDILEETKKDKRQFREKRERETPQGSGDSPEGGRDNFIGRTSPCVTRTLSVSHFPQTCNLELGEESLIGGGELTTYSLKE